ncbi:MAG: hypothetical protein JST01_07105 [Cyanobacteria bacterium SZAS TMP-1]|nr:hypothetical protein [Cyanobacteria bacterium SZAS TMP-1]
MSNDRPDTSDLKVQSEKGHSDKTPAPPTPAEIGHWLLNDATKASHGDATSATALVHWVQDLQKTGKLDAVGTAMAKDHSARVIKDSHGHVTELIFNSTSPMDLKLGAPGHASLNGHNEAALATAERAYVRRYNNEDIRLDTSLSAPAKVMAMKIEGDIMDGNRAALIADMKNLAAHPTMAAAVAARINKENQPVDIKYVHTARGSALQIHDFGGTPSTVSISETGKISARVDDEFSNRNGQALDPNKTLDSFLGTAARYRSQAISTLNYGETALSPEVAARRNHF